MEFPPTTTYAEKVLVGPVTAFGQNPVPWMEYTGKKMADEFIGLYKNYTNYDRRDLWTNTPENWGPGKVTLTQGSTAVTCTVAGTCNFRSNICNTFGSPVVTAITYMFFDYPVYYGGGNNAPYAGSVPVVPAQTAWGYSSVANCGSNDAMTLGTAFNIGAPTGTVLATRNWSFSAGPLNTAVNAWSAAFPSSIKFYDPSLVFLTMYYATGLTRYKDAFEWFADTQWENPINYNKGLMYRPFYYLNTGQTQEPLDITLVGLVLRALHGRDDYWLGIRIGCDYLIGSFLANGKAIGARGEFYSLMFLSACALADPDSAQRAHFITEITRVITQFNNWKCGGPGYAGKNFDCYGRDLGQWVRDQSSAGGSGYGVIAIDPPGASYLHLTKTNWKAHATAGSPEITFTADDVLTHGALTYNSTNINPVSGTLHRYAGLPVIFGNDSQDDIPCNGTGTGVTFACAEGVRPYVEGVTMISFTAPATTSTQATLNYDGTPRNIMWLATAASTAIAPATLTAGHTNTLFAKDGAWRLLYPLSGPGADGNGRLIFHMRCGATTNGMGWYWPQRVDDHKIKLRPFSTSMDRDAVGFVNWPGPSTPPEGCDFEIDANIWLGQMTQPFMTGIGDRAFGYAYAATVQAGAPNSTILTLLSDSAKFLVEYAYDPVTEGMYYDRITPGCEFPVGGGLGNAYGVTTRAIAANPGCTYDVASSNTARGLSPEIFGGWSYAYMYEQDLTRKQTLKDMATRLVGKTFGKPGFTCTGAYAPFCGDGYYASIFEETYTVGMQQYHVDKYLGFGYGIGGAMTSLCLEAEHVA